MYTQCETDIITLSSFTELSYEIKRRLLSDFESSSPDFTNHKNFLIKTLGDGVYNKVKEKFYDSAYRKSVTDELASKNVRCVTYFSDSYPECLKNISAPPVMLYCKGDISLLKTNCFSIVGSRNSMKKALDECEDISKQAASVFTIVSGMADGADACALSGALSGGGKVISVLANGFDHVYPACNAGLIKLVAEKGLLITEHSPHVQPKPYYFPFRNRIIAGLSRGTLVVSAGEKSGALITAEYALDYGRDVFAFPYMAGMSTGTGCNKLIKNGAVLTENIVDIFNCYGLDFITPETEKLSEAEKEVYRTVSELGEAFTHEIAARLKKQVYELLPVITSLEMKKLIARQGGNRYCALTK